jgi:hypothetical protein
MRALFWLNIVALVLLGWLAGQEIYAQTYGWWIGKRTGGYGHSPVILLLLAIPLLLSLGVLAANIWPLFSRNTKPRTKVLCGLSSIVLILSLVFIFSPPRDTLNSLTVAVLGPGKRADFLIYESAAGGRVKIVRALLDAGVPFRRNESLTSVGASYGRLEIIKMGIARGDDINAVGPGGRTPLRSAIANEQIAAIEFLLANGARATDADKDRISSLRSRPRR